LRAVTIWGLLLLGACARSDPPLPAIPGLSLGAAKAAEITERVWIEETPGAPEGALVVFLSDGTLLQDSCGELWRLSPWRRIDATTLVWEEDGATLRAEIAVAGEDRLALLIDGAISRRFRAAEAPMVCPERR
jgi:hypothetical protein